jgi:hypothetical protein
VREKVGGLDGRGEWERDNKGKRGNGYQRSRFRRTTLPHNRVVGDSFIHAGESVSDCNHIRRCSVARSVERIDCAKAVGWAVWGVRHRISSPVSLCNLLIC